MPTLPKIGFILKTLHLERRSRVYYGPDDTIKGRLVLEYQPPFEKRRGPPIEELFGPLHVDLVLEGSFKIEVGEDRARGEVHDWHRRGFHRTLCSRRVPLLHGAIRMVPNTPVEYPFLFHFPETSEESLRESATGYDGLEPLPPSFSSELHGQESYGSAQIVYRVIADVEMPGIDVRVVSRGGPYTVQYKPPGYPPDIVTGTSKRNGYFSVRSKYLIPEMERPRGVKGLFIKESELPKFVFSIQIASFPRSISADQGLVFEVLLVPDRESSTATIMPETSLKRCNVILRTATGMKYGGPDRESRVSAGPFGSELRLHAQVSPEGPFLDSKNGESIVKTVSTPPLGDISSTLQFDNLTRSYRVQIEIDIVVAKQTVGMTLHNMKQHSPGMLELFVYTSPPVHPPELGGIQNLGEQSSGPAGQLPPPQYDEQGSAEKKEGGTSKDVKK